MVPSTLNMSLVLNFVRPFCLRLAFYIYDIVNRSVWKHSFSGFRQFLRLSSVAPIQPTLVWQQVKQFRDALACADCGIMLIVLTIAPLTMCSCATYGPRAHYGSFSWLWLFCWSRLLCWLWLMCCTFPGDILFWDRDGGGILHRLQVQLHKSYGWKPSYTCIVQEELWQEKQ